jgi:hypothetical protein
VEARDILAGRDDILRENTIPELAQQQRIAPGDLVASGAELIVGVRGERLANEPSDGLGAQRRRSNNGGKGVGDHLAEDGGIRALLGRSDSDHNQEVKRFRPRQKVGEPAQRR